MPAKWPAFAALAAVVLLSLGVVVVDIFVDREIASRSGELVDNSLRSVLLADDMREHVHQLAGSPDPEVRTQALDELAFDLREYEPLVSQTGEAEELAKLRTLVGALRPAGPNAPHVLAAIDASLDHMVELNRIQTTHAVVAIERTDARGIMVDIAGGLVTIVLAGMVALWLRGEIARERELLRRHLDDLEDRRRELESFAGRVAHDLRGPLSPLRTYADLLAVKVPEAHDLAERIGRATGRMSSIIDGLLSLSVSGHPGAGETAVAPVVREVVDELAPRVPDVHVELSLDDSSARCSPAVLHQLVDNLVGNAVKYRSASRPLELAITCARKDGVVDLEVADNGIGMDEETAVRAFEPLYRAGDVQAVPGHGLGLAIVKRTVEALGGSCTLTSVRDSGTRVTLRLPVADRGAA